MLPTGLEQIAGSGFLGRLQPEVAAELAETGRIARYPTGTVLASSRSGTGPAIVVSGALRYYITARDGRQVTLRYVEPGALVGTLIDEQPAISSGVEVMEPTVLLHLDPEHLAELAGRRSDLSQALLDETTCRLRAAYRALEARAFLPVRARVARDLVDRAAVRGPLHAGARLDVTQQSLADAIGSVREVVARALGELKREGAITSRREGITVADPGALRRAAGDAT
jgi:CRP/FNR family transcriptional regulator